MHKVYQEIQHDPPVMGDCFRCCIASIFELPAVAVPHFIQHPDGGVDKDWFLRLEQWLDLMGLEPVLLDARDVKRKGMDDHMTWYFGSGYHVITGPSPRCFEQEGPGWNHSVVGHKGGMVHDPHPGGMGVTEATDYLLFAMKNPARCLRFDACLRATGDGK